jgi:hypothetical protein
MSLSVKVFVEMKWITDLSDLNPQLGVLDVGG